MSLIKCPECQKEISDTATACPNCGCPITSKANNPKQKNSCEKSKMYKTAFKQSAMMTIIFIFINLLSLIVPYRLKAGGIDGKAVLNTLSNFLTFIPSAETVYSLQPRFNSYYMFYIDLIFIITVIIIGTVFLLKNKNNRLDLKSFNTCKTLFIMWSGYIVLYKSCIINYLDMDIFINKITYSISIIVILGAFLFYTFKKKLKAEFSQYKTIFFIFGISSLLAIAYNLCGVWLIGASSSYILLTIVTIIMPIVMGITWCFNSGKSDTTK